MIKRGGGASQRWSKRKGDRSKRWKSGEETKEKDTQSKRKGERIILKEREKKTGE